MCQITRHFAGRCISALQAGEKSGHLPEALEKHTACLKTVIALRRELLSASVEPLFLTSASGAVLLLLLIWVVPTFTPTCMESGARLPGLTPDARIDRDTGQ